MVKSGFLAELFENDEIFSFVLKTELVIESLDLFCLFYDKEVS
jgi:hypothetical protein